jgi:hypothetical protein
MEKRGVWVRHEHESMACSGDSFKCGSRVGGISAIQARTLWFAEAGPIIKVVAGFIQTLNNRWLIL